MTGLPYTYNGGIYIATEQTYIQVNTTQQEAWGSISFYRDRYEAVSISSTETFPAFIFKDITEKKLNNASTKKHETYIKHTNLCFNSLKSKVPT